MKCISALFVDIGFWPYGKIRANQTQSNSFKILTLNTEIKKSAGGTFDKVPIIKAEYAKKCFWRAFPNWA